MKNQSTTWTIMVYISADDVLANFAIESLKQLRDAATDKTIVVAELQAEFGPKQPQDARIYFFDGKPEKRTLPIKSSRVKDKEIAKAKLTTIHQVDMTLPKTLTEFINYACEKSKTEHYCLILWGHGTELLLDEDRRYGTELLLDQDRRYGTELLFSEGRHHGTELLRGERRRDGVTNESGGRYLTFSNLKEAIRGTNLASGKLGRNHPKSIFDKEHAEESGIRHALDIIGIDACSMSMVEVASQLQDCVDFMVASQEDVPDTSFPYEKILAKLKDLKDKNDVEKICKMIPGLYRDAFRDYIATPGTGVKGLTLSSLRLKKIETITTPLKELATAMLDSRSDWVVRKKIFRARQESKGFVFGLFVDLLDFCECLEKELDKDFEQVPMSTTAVAVRSACIRIREALEVRDDGCIIENETVISKRCHGLSIYFPFGDESETDKAEELWAKGGTSRPLKGGTSRPLKERSARIEELEKDFATPSEFDKTKWHEFIKHGWSFILAEEAPLELDHYYSAQRVAANLLSLHKSEEVEKGAAAKDAA
jgi:hypothetical protein